VYLVIPIDRTLVILSVLAPVKVFSLRCG